MKMKKTNGIKKGLPPVYNDKTEIFIVGTFPSEKSLRAKEYYGNPTNQFWKLISDVLGFENLKNRTYNEKIKILLDNKIGIWDTINECERKGSLDTKIKKIYSFNDFNILKCPKLKCILANSEKSYNYLKNCNIPANVNTGKLVSSSKARTIKYEDKLANWKKNLILIT